MSTPHKRVPKQVKMEFHYGTGGELIMTCNQNCGYKHIMFPIDLMIGNQSHYVIEQTFEQIAHSLAHMKHHIRPGITEGEIENAEPDSSVSTGMPAHSAGSDSDNQTLELPNLQPPT